MFLSKKWIWLGSVFFFAAWMFFSSCEKDQFNTNPNDEIQFSRDTLTFDTVFTSLGTITKSIKVINPFNRDIKISRIRLKSNTSVFRLNINGVPGNTAENIILEAKDSIYIFVAATIDPTAADLPFIYFDDIIFEYNGRTSEVNVMAWECIFFRCMDVF